MKDECYTCHIRTVNKLIDKFKPAPALSRLFLEAASKLLTERKDIANPYLATDIHRLARNIINESNLYAEEKIEANYLLLKTYFKWKDLVEKSSNPFNAAAKLAVTGNIIDYGAHSVPEDIEKHILQLYNTDFSINQTDALYERTKAAESILYLGDNAGEIIFDKLFIETMQHPAVTYAVRGRPIINDVTLDDARQSGIDQVCKVISNGYDAPSTLLDKCSDEFVEEFNTADLIISKGQGNFEGLMDCERDNIFFMLMAKCRPIAEMLGVEEGGMIIGSMHSILRRSLKMEYTKQNLSNEL